MELEVITIILLLINIGCNMSIMRTLKRINEDLDKIIKNVDEMNKAIEEMHNMFKEHVKQCKC